MYFKAQSALPWSSLWAVGEPLLQHLEHPLFLLCWSWYLLLLSHLLTAAAQLSYRHFPRAVTSTADGLGSGWLELHLSDKGSSSQKACLTASSLPKPCHVNSDQSLKIPAQLPNSHCSLQWMHSRGREHCISSLHPGAGDACLADKQYLGF